MSTTSTQPVTAEELFEMGGIGRCELIRGEIVHMAPAGAEHGDVAAVLLYLIQAYVRPRRLGKVFAAETGFTIARNPDTTRAADVGFVSRDRLPKTKVRGFFPGAPDLAVEVISPSDRRSDVSAKVDDWLAEGTRSVWVVDPRNCSIEVYRPANEVHRYSGKDILSDEPALPGFILKLADVFDPAD